jgi:surface carbohydrate biosynthesis protein
VRCLILPCETRVREFDAKLLLGVVAARRGLTTIVGNKKTIDLRLASMPPGVYVGKSVTARSRHNLALARACGHRVSLWDEEGLVWASREVYWRTKVDGQTLRAPELLIAWGEENASAWRDHPDYAGTPIVAAGNPRADLLRRQLRGLFADEVDAIQAAHGRFILVNTNFSRVNHLQIGQSRHLKWLREKRPDDPRGGFAAHKFKLFHAFLAMLPALAQALPERQFIIRPHPSERLSTWQELAEPLPNVSVQHRGNVVAWLEAADALVHNGCTTAVEAFLVGCAAFAYMPLRSPTFDHPLPNGISLQCDDLQALASAVASACEDPVAAYEQLAADPARRQLAAANIAGCTGERLACEAILDALGRLLADMAPPEGARPGLARLTLALRRVLRTVEQRIPGTANYRPYLEHMFPSIGLAEARERARLLASCIGVPAPSIREVHAGVFALAP